MPSHRYDINAFVTALVSAEEYKNAAPELRDWHLARATALAKALHVEKDKIGTESLGDVEHMLNHAITAAAAHAAHPFSGYLECPKELYEIVEPHAGSISEAQRKLHDEWLNLARALLLRFHPHLADAATTSEQLRGFGFDDSDEPDALDFF